MTEEEKQKDQTEEDDASDREKAGEPGKTAEGGESPAGDAVESSGALPAATDPDRKLTLSDELRMALEEAEAAVTRPQRKEKASAPAGEEDLEIEVDEEGAEQEFDPNRVDEAEDTGPIKPSPAEIQLKMQILDLRQQLRAAELDIEQKIKEVRQNREQAQHVQKQFDAYKARMMKEKADAFNYGHEPLLKELLVVVDNMERALQHAVGEANVEAVIEGVQLIMRQFVGILEKFGVSPVEPAGQQFDPEFHQAMMQTEDASVPANTVVQVHQKGYLLKDRLLRPAMVVVSKGGSKPEAGNAEGAPAEPGGEDKKAGNKTE